MKKTILFLSFIIFTVSSSAITLDQGWNTLSVNSEVDISDAIEEEDSCEFEQYEGEYIWKYDNGEDDWAHPNFLQPEDGFYLYTDNNCELEVDQSSENDIDSLEIDSGWNMIGASYSQLSKVRSGCEITPHLEDGYFSFLLNEEWYHPLISELEMDNRGYWLYLEEERCQVDFDGETENSDENTEADAREYELLGDPLDTDFTVDPNGRWELSGDIRENDGEIRVDAGPGSAEAFELVEGDRPKEFELFRPDFDLTTSSGTGGPISVGREIEIVFEDKIVKGDSSTDSCEKISGSEQDIRSCTYETVQEDTDGLEIRGKLTDESPKNNLAATDTVSINVEKPESWEERTISLVEGESKEFSPSVSCEEPVEISYSGNSLSIERGSSSKSRGTPGEGTSMSLGDFVLEVENRDLNGDLEVTPRCGPEVG